MVRLPYNKLLTNLASSSRTGEYWPSVVFVPTSLRSVRTATTSGQYSPVRPSRLVSKRLVFHERVYHEVIDSKRGAKCQVGYNHLISNKRKWNNRVIDNHQQILLDLADFGWLEQPEGNLMDAISRVWYNGSYTIAAKPIKTLELHYTCTMIQFFNYYILYFGDMIMVESALNSNNCVKVKYF